MPIYELNGKRPSIGVGVFIHPTASIIGETQIGKDCFVGPGAVLRADFGPIEIGDGSSLQDNVVIHVSPGSRVVIGNRVIVGHQAILHDVILGHRCMVGMGAIVLQHVVCEEDVFIAAGAVVPQHTRIPRGKLAAGHPARIVRDVSAETKALTAAGVALYQDLTGQYLRTLVRIDVP
jgi:carbonic anhydrase/acetyltransferase-like protein (isoleucine patch superfamily)